MLQTYTQEQPYNGCKAVDGFKRSKIFIGSYPELVQYTAHTRSLFL